MKLTLATADFGNTVGVKRGEYPIPNVELDVVEVKPMIAGYRRMVRDVEFDICELAPTTYVLAKEHGAPFTALPAFLNRKFHHGDIQCGPKSGVKEPKDLAGGRIGIRAYTVTTALWVRGILAHEFGLDLDAMTWVTDDEEHVTTWKEPSNVEHVTNGQSLGELLAEGNLTAALGGPAGTGRAGAPKENWAEGAVTEVAATQSTDQPYSLIADPKPLEKSWYDRTGIYPMHGLIVVKDELIEKHPEVVHDIYQAFLSAKNDYVRTLLSSEPKEKNDIRFMSQRDIVGDDVLPYGVEANRSTLENLVKFALEQKILTRDVAIEDLFAPGIA